MSAVTVILDDAVRVEGSTATGRFLIPTSELEVATGWVRKPEGLCQGDVCVPVRDASALQVADSIDVAALATALGRRSVIDLEAGIAAISLDAAVRHAALDGLVAPEVTLPNLDGMAFTLRLQSPPRGVLVMVWVSLRPSRLASPCRGARR